MSLSPYSTSIRTVLLAVTLATAWPRPAHGQACCAATALVSPVRLQRLEQLGVGVRLRGRDILGSFAASGQYQSAQPGDVDLAQDLFAAARVGINGQVAVLLPIVQTRRSIPGLSSWGSGVGDLTVSGRYALLLPGEHAFLPGVALQAGVTIPTGRSVDQAHDTLATDATGTGTFEGTLGLDVQQVRGPWFVGFDGWLAQMVPRASGAIQQSFATKLTGVVSGGYVFRNETSAGLFLAGQRQGPSRQTADGKIIDSSALSMTTAGLGVIVPAGEQWRLQGTLSLDILVSGWGRNQLGGAGINVSLCRLWI
ncbi:MAG TPA: hypothetical protein VNO55_03865 [Polyangia bacterium]|nr:hypothetical protein [Polyangia bacterium]